MKLCKKLSVLLAAFLILLPACTQNLITTPKTEVVMGRYIEERWELPMESDAVPVLALRPDGRILAYIYGSGSDGGDPAWQIYSTSDGKDWRKEDEPGLKSLFDKGVNISDVAYGQEGECFLLYGIMDGENYVQRVARLTQDGAVQDISLEEDGALSYLYRIAAGDDGDLYVGFYNGVARFTMDGRFKNNIGGGSYPIFTYYNSSLALLDYGSIRGDIDTFKLYDTDTGEERQDLGLQALQSMQQGARIATGQDDGVLYLANANGIYRLVPEGTTWERMVDGNLCSLSIPSIGIDKLIPHGEHEFLILTTEQDKPALINYVYSASTPTRPDTELTVTALRKNNTLLQAAGEFHRRHPDVLVTVQVLLDEDGSATSADAIRALNTRLLAGNGPDLLLLDGLPLNSYIEKGVLADMGDWLSPVIEKELVSNVAGAIEKNGKLYAVPARFNMPTIWGRPDAVGAASNLESLARYAETNKDRKLLYAMDRESLFRFFYTTSAPAWLDGKGKLDEAEFAGYLEIIKRLANTVPGAVSKDDMVATTPGFTMTGIDTGGAVEVAFGKASLFSAELFGFDSLIIPNGAISTLNGLVVSADNTSIEDSLIPSHIALLPGQAAGVFIPGCVLGINAAGKHQDLAREFIMTVLGETVQYSDLSDGFPVNKSAIEKNISRHNDTYMSFSSTDEETGEATMRMEMGWPTPGARRAVCNLIGKLDTPYLPDDTLNDMILSETESFFNGTMSPSDTAAAVAARLELYLAEQG